jgi:glycosyltransferase involved in cell wall biosynthesis
MKPFFSIIIPTLNEELFITNLLENLRSQKLKNFETIVVDAKSKDKTRETILKYKKKLNIKLFQINKKNVSCQKNFGADKAKSKYLIFIDADSKIKKTFTKSFQSEIERKKGLVFFPYVEPEEKTPQMKAIYQFLNFIIDLSQKTNNPYSSVGCMCLEKNFFNSIGGFDEKLFINEDYNIAKKASDWGVRGIHLPNIKFTASFRKIKKEGKLKSLYKLIVGSSYYLFKGDVKKKIYNWEMGGHVYNKQDLKEKKAKLVKLDLNKIKKYLKDFISDIES